MNRVTNQLHANISLGRKNVIRDTRLVRESYIRGVHAPHLTQPPLASHSMKHKEKNLNWANFHFCDKVQLVPKKPWLIKNQPNIPGGKGLLILGTQTPRSRETTIQTNMTQQLLATRDLAVPIHVPLAGLKQEMRHPETNCFTCLHLNVCIMVGRLESLGYCEIWRQLLCHHKPLGLLGQASLTPTSL